MFTRTFTHARAPGHTIKNYGDREMHVFRDGEKVVSIDLEIDDPSAKDIEDAALSFFESVLLPGGEQRLSARQGSATR